MFRTYGVIAGLAAVAFGLGLFAGGGVRVDAQRSARVLEVPTDFSPLK